MRRRPIGGVAGVEGVGEIVVLDLYRLACGDYPREDVFVPADGGEGGIVLDPAQHVRYTCLVSIGGPFPRSGSPGVREAPPGPILSNKRIVSFRSGLVKLFVL